VKLGYVILYVPDVAAAVSFYEAAFGITRPFKALRSVGPAARADFAVPGRANSST
jgi:catechol 2,3-dioxygenase-like lactoylglutathione lyase family enzyme